MFKIDFHVNMELVSDFIALMMTTNINAFGMLLVNCKYIIQASWLKKEHVCAQRYQQTVQLHIVSYEVDRYVHPMGFISYSIYSSANINNGLIKAESST